MARRSILRSSFAVRLLVVVAPLAIAFAVLAGQSARLALSRGPELREDAERRLVRQTWTPTYRGAIRDRKGRVVAHDRPSFDVAVEYTVITGEWAERQAARQARRRTADWDALNRDQRREAIEAIIPEFRARADRTWSLLAEQTGLSRAEIDARRLAVRDDVAAMAAHIRERREAGQLRAYAGTLGISDEELARRTADLDRPDITRDARRLRLILAEEITREAETSIERTVSEPLREESMPHVIVQNADDETGFALRRASELRDPQDPSLPAYPGLAVLDAGQREYPMLEIPVSVDRAALPPPLRADDRATVVTRDVLGMILGGVRRGVYREDVERRESAVETDPALAARVIAGDGPQRVDRGRYLRSDDVGASGVERALEDDLRGLRGLKTDRLDGGHERTVPPQPGRDVTLTIDVMLQARVRALLEPSIGLARVQPWHDNTEHIDAADPLSPLAMPVGTAIDAAAVVLDVDTGEILAMVSTPTPADLPEDPEERAAFEALRRPYVNRAVSVPLPPGSIAKAIVLCGAHARGAIGLDERISCTGHLIEGRDDMLRCWIFKRNHGLTHDMDLGHAPDGGEALKVSCNIFFYTLGQRLGPDRIADLYRGFGVGEPLGLPLENVLAGWIGPAGDPRALSEGDAIQMGIGQGPIAWTPVHAADAFATLARSGVRIRPRLVADAPSVVTDLGLDPAAVSLALRGLDLAVNDPRGTAHAIPFEGSRFEIFDTPGVKVWGKTGTATAPPLVIDGSVVRRGDHSWFVLLCGRDRPRYAIAVVAEYAGSGGRVSGPIANQIVRALVDEGYL